MLGEFRTGIARRGRERGQFCTGSGSACGIKFSLLGLLVAKAVKVAWSGFVDRVF